MKTIHTLLLIIVSVAILGLTKQTPTTYRTRVTRVFDGDTVEVDRGPRSDRLATPPPHVRLFGIDCPEKGQPFWKQAQKRTEALILDREVVVTIRGTDRYGRNIGEIVLASGERVDEILVSSGLCWWYRTYAAHEKRLENAEEIARLSRRGLWSEPAPTPPWAFRYMARKRKEGAKKKGTDLQRSAPKH